YLDKPDQIYQVALQKGLRSPFKPADELTPAAKDQATPGEAEKKDEEDKHDSKPATDQKDRSTAEKKPAAPKPVTIDYDCLAQRLYEVPVRGAGAARHRPRPRSQRTHSWYLTES